MSCVLIDARTRTVSSETRNSPPSTGSLSSVSSAHCAQSGAAQSARCTGISLTHCTAAGKTFFHSYLFLRATLIIIIILVTQRGLWGGNERRSMERVKQCATDLMRDKDSDMGDFVWDKSADLDYKRTRSVCDFKKLIYFFLIIIFLFA